MYSGSTPGAKKVCDNTSFAKKGNESFGDLDKSVELFSGVVFERYQRLYLPLVPRTSAPQPFVDELEEQGNDVPKLSHPTPAGSLHKNR